MHEWMVQYNIPHGCWDLCCCSGLARSVETQWSTKMPQLAPNLPEGRVTSKSARSRLGVINRVHWRRWKGYLGSHSFKCCSGVNFSIDTSRVFNVLQHWTWVVSMCCGYAEKRKRVSGSTLSMIEHVCNRASPNLNFSLSSNLCTGTSVYVRTPR